MQITYGIKNEFGDLNVTSRNEPQIWFTIVTMKRVNIYINLRHFLLNWYKFNCTIILQFKKNINKQNIPVTTHFKLKSPMAQNFKNAKRGSTPTPT